MNFEIRKSKYCDLSEIVELMFDDDFGSKRESKSLTEYEQSYEEIYKSDCFDIYVMIDSNDQVIGTYQIMFLPHLSFKGTKRAQIESVRIKKSLRGQGLGKKLIEHAIEIAKDNNCGIFQLTSNKDRSDQAHGFYKDLGLSPTHEGYKLYF